MIIREYEVIPVYITKDNKAFIKCGLKKYTIIFTRGNLDQIEKYFNKINNYEIVYLTDLKKLAIREDQYLNILPTKVIEEKGEK
jgi:hypothetical protein